MDFSTNKISYRATGYFSKIIDDYLNGNNFLQNFYVHQPSLEGIQSAIKARKNFATDRHLLVNELKKQYQEITFSSVQEKNISLLLNENTFTVTTAHQPNIFTGPLYFIYKIFHAIKLADELNKQLPEYHFVPIYYMGSEDADLDELGYLHVDGKKLTWQTNQTGAVGRMKVDNALLKLINEIYGRVGVEPYGEEIVALFKATYTLNKTIQQATLELVNTLFAEYGLFIIIPDNAALKKSFQPVIEKELTEQFSHKEVDKTIALLSSEYKIQTRGRTLNLFYLIDDKRERIEIINSKFQVPSLKIEWSKEEILGELQTYPERFSANVILRGVFQETILPNVVFIGGGGELAYWLELKNVFAAVKVPYPVLLIRNSFAVITKQQAQKFKSFGFSIHDLFTPVDDLLREYINKQSVQKLNLQSELENMNELYNKLQQLVATTDVTLGKHTEALKVKALNRLHELEKKMFRAEKKKFEVEKNKIKAIRAIAFPDDNLQERVENFSLLYAKYGKSFLNIIYTTSKGLQQEFEIIEIH